MADIVDRQTRSRMMAGIGGKNTRPELTLRRGLHAAGYRYRLHAPGLPGKPDLVFPSRHAVILVNGCFWHGHDCPLFKWPATRKQWWRKKITETQRRDARITRELLDQQWRVLVIWECALKGPRRRTAEQCVAMAARFLEGSRKRHQIQGKPPSAH